MKGRALCKTFEFYFFYEAFLPLRYRQTPSAANPEPNRRREAGSGVATVLADPEPVRVTVFLLKKPPVVILSDRVLILYGPGLDSVGE